MTLIIGCITKDFGIIAGDTQLSSGDLKRGEFERLVQTKVHQYGPDFMMGILGKWGYIEPMKDCTGTQIDYFKTLNREIQKSAVKDKLGYLSKFLPGKPNIEATAIYIKKESNFILDCITNDGNEKTIKKITIADKRLVFNEPFFDTDPNYVESKVRDFIKINKLTDGLPDSLFLLNNIILEIIAEGKTLDINFGGISSLNNSNSVGGYLTMQVMTNDIHHLNCLWRAYVDPKVLLDKTTYPFAASVDKNKKINYVDNLAMLVWSSTDGRNCITKELNELLAKQIEYIDSEEIIDTTLMNDLIDLINDRYNLKLSKHPVKKASGANLALFFGDDEEENYEFYKRFF